MTIRKGQEQETIKPKRELNLALLNFSFHSIRKSPSHASRHAEKLFWLLTSPMTVFLLFPYWHKQKQIELFIIKLSPFHSSLFSSSIFRNPPPPHPHASKPTITSHYQPFISSHESSEFLGFGLSMVGRAMHEGEIGSRDKRWIQSSMQWSETDGCICMPFPHAKNI